MQVRINAFQIIFWGCFTALSSAFSETGQLYVDLDAADIVQNVSNTVEGVEGYVTLWKNRGTEGDFVTPTNCHPPVLRTIGGVKAVQFVSNNGTTLTNGPSGSVPESLIKEGAVWSVEAWIYQQSFDENRGAQDYLSWTPREIEGGPGGNGSACEFRYGNDVNIAVEHRGNNLPWGTKYPALGVWHHFATTRDRFGRERLYLDGILVLEKDIAPLNLNPGGFFTLGSTYHAKNNSFQTFFNGAIAKLRVHSGVMTPGEVFDSFYGEAQSFGLSPEHDANWLGTGWQHEIGIATNKGVILQSDLESPLALDGGDYKVPRFFFPSGTLGLKDTKLFVETSNGELEIGYREAKTRLTIESGSLEINRQGLKIAGYPGAGTDITLGGAESPATLRSIAGEGILGASGGQVKMSIKNRGAFICDRMSLGIYPGGSATAIVEAGGLLQTANPNNGYLYLGHVGATGIVENSGTILVGGDLKLGEKTKDSCGHAELHVYNGGVVEAVQIHRGNEGAESILTVDGGTLRASGKGNRNFIENLDCFAFSNGITFDIKEADREAGIAVPMIETNKVSGSVVTKKGAGTLIFKAPVPLDADILVEEGALIFEAGTLPAGYRGTIRLQKGAAICSKEVGGAQKLIQLLDSSSEGTLLLGKADDNQRIDLSTHSGLAIGAYEPITLGQLTTADGADIVFNSRQKLTYGSALPSGAMITVRGMSDTAEVELTGSSSTIRGLNLERGVLTLSDENAAGSLGPIILYSDTVLRINCRIYLDTFWKRVKAYSGASNIQILLTWNARESNVDMGNLPGTVLGSVDPSLNQGGVIIPYGDTCFLGGGYYNKEYDDKKPGFTPGKILETSQTPVKVIYGKQASFFLSDPERYLYTGGTVISNNTHVVVKKDCFGAAPVKFDPDNILLDGCFLSFERDGFSFNENRGIWIGPNGVSLKPWGNKVYSVPGGLGGSGPINITDGGCLALIGTNNCYNGRIKKRWGPLTIGQGEFYSWVSEGGIDMGGTEPLTLNTDRDAVFNDTVSGSGSLVKEGKGVLTVTRSQSYTGKTEINGGGILLKDQGSLASAEVVNKGKLIIPEGANLADRIKTRNVRGTGPLCLLSGESVMEGNFFIEGAVQLSPGVSLSLSKGSKLEGSVGIEMDRASVRLPAVGKDGGTEPIFKDIWQCNGSARIEQIGGTNCVRVTEDKSKQRGSAFMKQRVSVEKPFTFSMVYRAEHKGNDYADGFAILLQNNKLEALGGDGGSLGAQGIDTGIGWGISVFQGLKFRELNKGKLTDSDKIEGIDILQGPVSITFSYDLFNLAVTLEQGENRVTASRAVNLSSYFGKTRPYIGVSGGTGGRTVGQVFSNLELTQEEDDTFADMLLPGIRVSGGNSSILFHSTQGTRPCSKIGKLSLEDDANLLLKPEQPLAEGEGASLYPRDIEVKGEGVVEACDGASLILGPGISFSQSGVLTISGPVEVPGTAVTTLHVPAFSGYRELIRLPQGSGLTVQNFALETDAPPPVSLGMKGDIIFAFQNNSTLLILE